MSFIANILGGGVAKLVGSIGSIIDDVTTSGEERDAAKLKMAEIIQAENAETEKTLRKELEAKERIIVAELNQEDKYVKRARPSIIYVGLIMAIGPAIAKIAGVDLDVQDLVHAEFWTAWKTTVSIYAIGRTAEKAGIVTKIKKKLTGA